MSERAREAAARAFHGVLFAEGVIIQTNALDAAIDAFLAALSADSEMVERVAKAVWESDIDAGRFHATWEAQPRCEKQNYRTIARAAIAATLKQEAEQ